MEGSTGPQVTAPAGAVVRTKPPPATSTVENAAAKRPCAIQNFLVQSPPPESLVRGEP